MLKVNYHYYFQRRPEMLEFIPEGCMKFIEIGCGDGLFAEQLKQISNSEIWGIELHAETATLAESKLDKVFTGDFLDLFNRGCIPKHYFDCIIFNDVLEHFTDPHLVLEVAKQLLKPGGYITSSIPNFRYVGNLWEILIDGDFRYKDSGILDRTHYRFFTLKSVVRMFDETGYRIVKIRGVNPTRSIKVRLAKWLSFNKLADIPYMNIASLVQVK